MIITDVKPIKLQFWPPNPPRDGLAAIPTRDVFRCRSKPTRGITGIGEGFALGSLESLANADHGDPQAAAAGPVPDHDRGIVEPHVPGHRCAMAAVAS